MDFSTKNAVYSNEQLVLTNSTGFRIMLGPNLKLRNCELVLDCSPDSLKLLDVSIESCTVIAKRLVDRCNFNDARISATKFLGHFKNCDFGRWAAYEGLGSIDNCDFFQAQLDDCRFFGCNVDELILPNQWPQIFFFTPTQAASYSNSESNIKCKAFLEVLASNGDECVLKAILARTLATRLNTKEPELVEFLEKLPFAKFSFPENHPSPY